MSVVRVWPGLAWNTPRYKVRNQNRARLNLVLLGQLLHRFFLHERRTRASQRRVSFEDDALFGTVSGELGLREERVTFDLIRCGDNLGGLEELVEVGSREVGDADLRKK